MEGRRFYYFVRVACVRVVVDDDVRVVVVFVVVVEVDADSFDCVPPVDCPLVPRIWPANLPGCSPVWYTSSSVPRPERR
jgi:hypothetical protein